MSMHTVAVMGLGVRGKIHLHGLLGKLQNSLLNSK